MRRATLLVVLAAAATALSDSTTDATSSMTVVCTSNTDSTFACTTAADGDAWTATATYSPDTAHKSFFGTFRAVDNSLTQQPPPSAPTSRSSLGGAYILIDLRRLGLGPGTSGYDRKLV